MGTLPVLAKGVLPLLLAAIAASAPAPASSRHSSLSSRSDVDDWFFPGASDPFSAQKKSQPVGYKFVKDDEELSEQVAVLLELHGASAWSMVAHQPAEANGGIAPGDPSTMMDGFSLGLAAYLETMNLDRDGIGIFENGRHSLNYEFAKSLGSNDVASAGWADVLHAFKDKRYVLSGTLRDDDKAKWRALYVLRAVQAVTFLRTVALHLDDGRWMRDGYGIYISPSVIQASAATLLVASKQLPQPHAEDVPSGVRHTRYNLPDHWPGSNDIAVRELVEWIQGLGDPEYKPTQKKKKKKRLFIVSYEDIMLSFFALSERSRLIALHFQAFLHGVPGNFDADTSSGKVQGWLASAGDIKFKEETDVVAAAKAMVWPGKTSNSRNSWWCALYGEKRAGTLRIADIFNRVAQGEDPRGNLRPRNLHPTQEGIWWISEQELGTLPAGFEITTRWNPEVPDVLET